MHAELAIGSPTSSGLAAAMNLSFLRMLLARSWIEIQASKPYDWTARPIVPQEWPSRQLGARGTTFGRVNSRLAVKLVLSPWRGLLAMPGQVVCSPC